MSLPSSEDLSSFDLRTGTPLISSRNSDPFYLIDFQIVLPAVVLVVTVLFSQFLRYETFERLLFLCKRISDSVPNALSPILPSNQADTMKPRGIQNPGQACYQNSVIQGLASLQSLPRYLENISEDKQVKASTTASLRYMIKFLNAPRNAFSLKMPAILARMPIHEPQDAQEFYVKVLDYISVEAEAYVRERSTPSPGMEEFAAAKHDNGYRLHQPAIKAPENPLVGMTAQRLGCLECGFTEGMTLTPFNCLTLSMPLFKASDMLWNRSPQVSLQQLLDEYCEREVVDDVVCPKCTCLAYRQMLEARKTPSNGKPQSTKFQTAVKRRLQATNAAIDTSDYSDDMLYEKIGISPKMQVRRQKAKQIGIGRPPQALVVHVNRSVFNEQTGNFYKNNSMLEFPESLDLGKWTVPAAVSGVVGPGMTDAREDMLRGEGRGPSRWQYVLRATVIHVGGHTYGHYVCNRKYPKTTLINMRTGKPETLVPFAEQSLWWKLSDEHVFKTTEDAVLDEGNVFMLFYELCNAEDGLQRIAAQMPLPESDDEVMGENGEAETDADMEMNGFVGPKPLFNGHSPTIKRRDPIGDKIRALGMRATDVQVAAMPKRNDPLGDKIRALGKDKTDRQLAGMQAATENKDDLMNDEHKQPINGQPKQPTDIKMANTFVSPKASEVSEPLSSNRTESETQQSSTSNTRPLPIRLKPSLDSLSGRERASTLDSPSGIYPVPNNSNDQMVSRNSSSSPPPQNLGEQSTSADDAAPTVSDAWRKRAAEEAEGVLRDGKRARSEVEADDYE